MKCASCGNEFGNGANCQYCGVDRFTGLGNYRGYHIPSRSLENSTHSDSGMEYQSATNQSQITNVGSTVCFACGEIIPADSKFCPYCSKELYVTCPKCGNKYSSQFPACNQCGTNYINYQEQKRREEEEERKQKEEKEEKNRLIKLNTKSIVVPYGTRTIGAKQYQGYGSLRSVTIPDSLYSIGEEAFQACTQLEEVVIPNSVTKIGRAAFAACFKLKTITIPKTVSMIGPMAFGGCRSLQKINLDPENQAYRIIDGVLYDKNVTELIKMPACNPIKELIIPNTVTKISIYALDNCTNLQSVVIPKSVKSIEMGSFSDCKALERVSFQGCTPTIDTYAFSCCKSLSDLSLEEIKKICKESHSNFKMATMFCR
jgi:hypothetical protein